MAESVAWESPVDDRIKTIADKLRDTDFKDELPGLVELLDEYIAQDGDIDNIFFHRKLLRVFRDAARDHTYEDLLDQYSDDEKSRVEKFVDGEDAKKISKGFKMGPSLGAREEMEGLRKAKPVKVSSSGPIYVDEMTSEELKEKDHWFHRLVHGIAHVLHIHDGDDEIEIYKDVTFQNWGLNLRNDPLYTCVPSTKAGIRSIVKFAAQNNLSVRCSGYRHSWSPIFGRDGQILISLLKLKTASQLPNTAALPLPESEATELEKISFAKGKPRIEGNILVRVGCSTTNERLRRWCVKNQKCTIPLNVIMVEITMGGSNAPICHGAGRRHRTLSDLVREIEFVNAHGELQTVTNVEHLKAASGCFGLMGVVTSIVMEFEPMTYALTSPKKIPVIKALPPPPDMPDDKIPKALFIARTEEEKIQDQKNFERQASDDYYCEWFWFPFSDNAWVNCWNETTDPKGVVDFPDDFHIFLSFIQSVTMNVLQSTPLLAELINAVGMNEAAVTLISRAAMLVLGDKPVKTYLPDALHFQRAIQNVRVRDIEIEIPLQPKPKQPSVPDYTVVQRAWWDAIIECYNHSDTCPQRMPLELRIMGGSDITLAPQRGNELGTASIEILTLRSARKNWIPYAQKVLDKWMSYTDADGKLLNTRPHWAKEWKEFTVNGKPWEEKLKNETYKGQITEFKKTLAAIGQDAKEKPWTLGDLKKRFSNNFFDDFIFDDVS